MVVRRRSICLSVCIGLGGGCATTPEPQTSPEPARSEPARAAAAKNEPPPAVEPPLAVEPTPAVEPAPAVEPEPELAFEPLSLDAEEMRRAKKMQPFVKQASADHRVDANLINGIIWAESKFNPKARNRSGAKGLMQLMPITARGMGKKLGRPVRVYDPEFSIQAGTKLLSIMLDRFDGDVELALFAYGRGGGRVRSWQANGETEIPEGVRKFIARVKRGQQTFESLGFPEV